MSNKKVTFEPNFKPKKPKKLKRKWLDEEEEEEEEEENNMEEEEQEGEEIETGKDFGGGYKLEPFNLKFEREEGHFDKEGYFIEKRKKNKDYDAWLEEYDELQKENPDKAIYKKKVFFFYFNSKLIYYIFRIQI